MFLFQEGTPDTSSYLMLGYAVILVTMLVHLASLALRRRSLQRDIELLEDLVKED